MKVAHQEKGDKEQALNQMLSSYRATPHPSTGIAPGNIVFRSGYQKDFPRQCVNDDTIRAALSADREDRERKAREVNLSNHRMQSDMQPNQLVYIRNNARGKFDPIFGPELHKVVDIKGNGVTLLRLSDSKVMRRHLDDVKDATAVGTSELDDMCWINTPQQAPQTAVAPPPNTTLLAQAPTTPLFNNGWCNVDERNTLPGRRRGGDGTY